MWGLISGTNYDTLKSHTRISTMKMIEANEGDFIFIFKLTIHCSINLFLDIGTFLIHLHVKEDET